MCARDWTRTSTALLPLAPETSASTNSATRAIKKPKKLTQLQGIIFQGCKVKILIESMQGIRLKI